MDMNDYISDLADKIPIFQDDTAFWMIRTKGGNFCAIPTLLLDGTIFQKAN